MSPASNNERAGLITERNLEDAACGEEPEVAILCEPETAKPTKALARRDIASGQSEDIARLIRFVVSPDGVLTPDVAQKLPGRGLWVASERTALEIAIKRNIFSKAAKRQVKAAPELIPLVHDLLRRRCLDLLGLARREGGMVNGFEKVVSTLKSRKAAWLVEARDGAEDGRTKVLAVARATDTPVAGMFSNAELGLALGQENVVHAALLNGHRAQRWAVEMARLAGFEPLIPTAWSPDGADGGRSP